MFLSRLRRANAWKMLMFGSGLVALGFAFGTRPTPPPAADFASEDPAETAAMIDARSSVVIII
jgi:hypothetical protein